MAVTAKKVNDGLTEHVSSEDDRERIRRSLYRTDASAIGSIVPAWRNVWTEAEIAQYHEQGYLAMDGLLTPEQVGQAKQALADIAHRRVWNEKVGIQEEPYFRAGGSDERLDDPELRIRKLWMFCQADKRLASMAVGPRLVPLLDQLIGSGHRMIQDMALLKPPFRGAEKPWHQDTP
jgi:phytanoyl-CoA hydroxylase